MNFHFLDKESENLLKALLKKDSILNDSIGGTAIQHLIENGFINGVNSTTLSDLEPQYVLRNITQKGKMYFELKKEVEKEQNRLSRREWKIAILSATVGALIGLIPTFISMLGGK
jgi:hypothetical protein